MKAHCSKIKGFTRTLEHPGTCSQRNKVSVVSFKWRHCAFSCARKRLYDEKVMYWTNVAVKGKKKPLAKIQIGALYNRSNKQHQNNHTSLSSRRTRRTVIQKMLDTEEYKGSPGSVCKAKACPCMTPTLRGGCTGGWKPRGPHGFRAWRRVFVLLVGFEALALRGSGFKRAGFRVGSIGYLGFLLGNTPKGARIIFRFGFG